MRAPENEEGLIATVFAGVCNRLVRLATQERAQLKSSTLEFD